MEAYEFLTKGPAISEVPESAMAAQPSTQIPTITHYLSEKRIIAIISMPGG